ncbi:MAG: Fic family protein [Bacteroidota bacterium]
MSQKKENKYVLSPLPPPKSKIESIEILRQLSRSSRVLGELKGIARTIPNQKMLINAIVLREAKDSSAIENIITTHDELYKALSVKAAPDQETKEVINYRKAILKGFDLIQAQGFLRHNDIIALQNIIIENKGGIRKTPGKVLKNDRTGEVVYTPPQDFQETNALLSNFLEYYNLRQSYTEPLINLAILHYQFESIHPFYDGNGRTGRILNILYLILNGLIEIPILYLSSYINENKSEYYRLLNLVNKSDEWESWIIYMLKAIEATSKQTIERITQIKESLEATIEFVAQTASKIYKKELIELLYEHPYSKIEYVVKKMGVERKAASRYLQKLEGIGVLQSQKIGKEKIYMNVALLEILKRH